MNILRPNEAELEMIGIALSGQVRLSDIGSLNADDFEQSDCAMIFQALTDMISDGVRVDPAGLDERLTRERGSGTANALMQIAMDAHRQYRLNTWRAGEVSRIVSEAAQRRRLIATAERTAQAAADPTQDLAEVESRLTADLREGRRISGGWISIADAAQTAYLSAYDGEKAIPTGIKTLDDQLGGGFHNGELTVIGARPAVGKSEILLHFALAAAEAGKQVGLVSLEMSAQQIGVRLLGRLSGLNAKKLRDGRSLTDVEQSRLSDGYCACGEYRNNVHLLVRSGMTIEDLQREARAMVDAGRCDLLLIDYCQLLQVRGKYGSDFERLGIVSRGLKSIALDCDVPIIAAAQVRRQQNGGILRAPNLDELRGSGDLEQDSDNVLLLHRVESTEDALLNSNDIPVGDWLRAAKAAKINLLTIEVGKQRQGRCGRIWMYNDPARCAFWEV